MRVLFLNRVYPPAEGATGWLLQELAETLAQKGFEVSVVTSKTADGESDRSSRVRVERAPVIPFTRSSHWRRALSYLSVYPALLVRALRQPRPDVVMSMTDPPLQLFLAPVIAWIKGSAAVHWAQDIYPEVAEELGVLQTRSLNARLLRALSNWALRRHQKIIVVGRCMRERLILRGVPEDRIEVIPNWAQSCSSSMAGGFSPPPGYRVMYSGNFGLAHDFSAIIKAVASPEKLPPNMRFIFVGGGPRLKDLQERLGAQPHVEFLPQQPKKAIGRTLASADVHLVCMKQELAGLVVPSKIYGALAASRPVIFIGPENCEAAFLLKKNRAGEVISPEDADGLIAAIHRYADPRLREEHGQNARGAAAGATLQIAAEKFAALLRDAVGKKKRRGE